MWPCSSSIGTVSVKVSVPVILSTSVTGSPWLSASANSEMPPSWRIFSSKSSGPRRSRTTSSSPGTM